MVFNIAVIITLVVQALIILWLVDRMNKTTDMLTALFAYFQRLAQDLGYPVLSPMPDEDDELKNWSEARKKQDGET